MKKIIIFIILINISNIACANSYSSYKNSLYNFNNGSINKLILDENIISDILIDDNNIYFFTEKLLYIANKNLSIKHKININNIKKITQDNNYIYAISFFTNYKINKNNGNVEYKYILNINFDNIFTYNNITSQNNIYNISSNESYNKFNEIFVNTISENDSGIINLNLSEFNVTRNIFCLNVLHIYNSICMDTVDNEFIVDIQNGNRIIMNDDSTSFRRNSNEKIKINSSDVLIKNNVTIEGNITSNNFNKNIKIGYNYTNLFPTYRKWGVTYWNNNSYPIIISGIGIVNCLASACDAAIGFKNNNVNLEYVYSYGNVNNIGNLYYIIPPNTNYSIFNVTSSGNPSFNLLSWYENKMELGE